MQMPEFPKIKVSEIPKASVAQFLGGTKITEFFGNKVYKFPYSPAPFHSAFVGSDGLTLNVGAFKTIKAIENGFLSTRRIDIIIYKDINDALRNAAARKAMEDADDPKAGWNSPTYGWTDFLRFWKPLKKLFKPSNRRFCSEDCAIRLWEINCKASDKAAVDTAPWDLYTYAMANPDKCDIRTLWVGDNFGSKYNQVPYSGRG